MNSLKRLYWLSQNLIRLLLELSRNKNFYWRMNSCRLSNCKLDKTVVIYGSYTLINVNIDYASYVSHNAHISNTSIGKFCSIGPNLISGWGIHPIGGISTNPAFYSSSRKSKIVFCDVDIAEEHRPIVIGNDVFIGANVTILDGISIGDGAVIGAGAVVSKNIPPYAIAVGCPIKVVKYRFSPEIIHHLLKSKWWEKDLSVLKKVNENFYKVEDFINKI